MMGFVPMDSSDNFAFSMFRPKLYLNYDRNTPIETHIFIYNPYCYTKNEVNLHIAVCKYYPYKKKSRKAKLTMREK